MGSQSTSLTTGNKMHLKLHICSNEQTQCVGQRRQVCDLLNLFQENQAPKFFPNITPQTKWSGVCNIFIIVSGRVILHTIGHHLLPKYPVPISARRGFDMLDVNVNNVNMLRCFGFERSSGCSKQFFKQFPNSLEVVDRVKL